MKTNVYSVIKSTNDEESKITLTRGDNSDTIIIKCEVPVISISKQDIRNALKEFEAFDVFEKERGNSNE